MTFTTGTSTGSSENDLISSFSPRHQISHTLRDVITGVDQRNTQYTFREFTDDPISHDLSRTSQLRQKISRDRSKRNRKPQFVANREHVARILRGCQGISNELFISEDPIDSALLGGQLTNELHELWNFRRCRESDWIEILNIVQIAVPAEEFEFLPKTKRLAIRRIFNEALLTRTVGSAEVDRCLKILTEADFNVWRGLSESE